MSEYVLALETSGPAGGVALATSAGEIRGLQRLSAEGRNASQILPAIDALLRAAAARPSDIRLVCYSAGPGSFTGLRVAVTIARMLQSTNACAVVAVPTMTVLARNATDVPPEVRRLLTLLDAKAGHAFVGEFERAADGTWRECAPARMASVEEITALCDSATLALGPAALRHSGAVRERGALIGEVAQATPRAEIVAELGIELARGGAVCAPHEILPIYVRRPEAEEVYEQRRAAARERRGE